MHFGARQASCPNCGGPIEFKLGASATCICPWCRHSVVRTDREISSLGQVADLVPTAPFMTVGDIGRVDGREFVVGGRVQLDHGRGPWDEFYVEFRDTREWAWVAKAQGRFYITQPTRPSAPLPDWAQLSPGQQGTIEGRSWAVAERGESTLLSAEGELPFPTRPGEVGRFVDLEGPDGAFGTIDYGDASSPPHFFVGQQVAPERVELTRQAVGPRPEEKVAIGAMKCPSCGAPMPIHAPDTTERAACQFCHALVDVKQGGRNLQLARKLQQPELAPLIPLGTEGTIRGEDVICIGFMQRATVAYGETYPWQEYLFHTRGGYRWLTEDGGHFTWLKPVSGGSVAVSGMKAQFGGRSYRLFSTAHATVRYVAGEFYWKVEVGDAADLADFIAPPRLLSEERTNTEVTWSEGEYLEGKELWGALSLSGSPPPKEGVGAAQPNPVRLGFASVAAAILVALFCLTSLIFDFGADQATAYSGAVAMPPMQGDTPQNTYASFTPTFPIAGGEPVEIKIQTSSDNQWVAINGALVNQNSAKVYEFFVDAGYYHGYSGGSWSEGSRNGSIHLSSLDPGNYFLRLDPQWQNFPQPGAPAPHTAPTAQIQVLTGKRGLSCACCSFFLLLCPWFFLFMRRGRFESRRNENSNLHG